MPAAVTRAAGTTDRRRFSDADQLSVTVHLRGGQTMEGDEDADVYLPTPAQIRGKCRAILAAMSERQRQQRLRVDCRSTGPVELPTWREAEMLGEERI